MELKIQIEKKILYLLSVILIFGIASFVYAYESGGPPSNFGHSADEIEELDPTVPAALKDGIDWAEITNKPIDLSNYSNGTSRADWNNINNIPPDLADGDDGGGCSTFTYYKEEYIFDYNSQFTGCPQPQQLSDWDCINNYCISRGYVGRNWAGYWNGGSPNWFFSFACYEWQPVTVCV